MNSFNSLILFIGTLNLGDNFLSTTTFCLFLASLLLLIFSITFKRLRLLNKTVVIGVTVATFFLCIAITLCKFYALNSVDFLQLIFCSVLAVLETAVLVSLCLLPKSKSCFIQKNGIIGKYFEQNKDMPLREESLAFSKNPFKKAERLKTFKMFERDLTSDFNVNFSYILGCIEALDFSTLSSADKTELSNLKLLIERFSHKQLSDNERDLLCSGIRKLLKLSAKYDEVLQAKI